MGLFGASTLEAVSFQNVFADLSSKESDSLIRATRRCTAERCCALQSSEECETVAADGAAADPFAHVTLRTAFYSAVGDAESRVFARPIYANRQLEGLDIALLKTNGKPEIFHMVCADGKVCVDTKGRYLALPQGSYFSLAALAPIDATGVQEQELKYVVYAR